MDGNYLFTKNHLFIAGTGRAGTSFLVRFLTELGFDTHLSRRSDAAAWDENANAGLEDAPFLDADNDLPYVIKSPWLYACIDEALSNGTFRADAVLIPVRDLTEAATSRSVVERRAIHQSAPWMSEQNPSWEEWGQVPGGIIYSLNPIDQGRLLAVGFHHLVQRLVAADIPVVFLAFPRLVEDAAYLVDKLRPLLPPGIGEDAACAAHARVADRSKVRVGNELQGTGRPPRPQHVRGPGYASPAELEAAALKRELARLRHRLSTVEQEMTHLTEQVTHLTEQECLQRSAAEELKNALNEAEVAQGQARRERDDAFAALSNLKEETRRTVQELTDRTVQRAIALEETIARLRASRSWRLMRPYRVMGSVIRSLGRTPVRLPKHEH